MAYTVQDIPAEYRTLSRRDHLKRMDHLLITERIPKILSFSNFNEDNDSTEHTSSFRQDNHLNFFHDGNVFIIYGKASERKLYSENLKKIEFKIEKECQISNIDKEIYADTLNTLKNNLANLSFNDIAVEFIDNESIHFALSFDNNKLLMIDKFINPLANGLSENQVFYSFFINKNLISSNVVEISEFIKKFQAYITL